MKSRDACARTMATLFCVGCLLAAPGALLQAQDAPRHTPPHSFSRVPTPRADKTIFSPLDLPTPNRRRLASGAPGPDYWQQRADYTIKASLDDKSRLVKAVEEITYHNNSPAALSYIWMSLPQNLARRDSKGAMRGGSLGRPEKPADKDKGFSISSMSAGGQELVRHIYGTVARVELPRPVPPNGGEFTFRVVFSFTVSGVSGRMGVRKGSQGPVFELAQWFPNVCVYDDVHGWNTLPYMGSGEFYTNFGDYDVSLTVPRSHLVSATGVLQNPGEVLTSTQRERLARARHSQKTLLIRTPKEVQQSSSRPQGRGPLTWHFKAHDVRTFAWASSRAFIWDAAFLKGTGPNQQGTLVQSIYPKEALPLWKKSTEMLLFSIKAYSKRWFPYPYPMATNVNGLAGGMEYPMIIFCAARGPRKGNQTRAEHGLFGVTTHEIGHNWFPMTVNSDERRHAWMDEGFNTFINHYSTLDYYGKDRRARSGGGGFGRAMLGSGQQPIETAADNLQRMRLGMLEYAKTGVGLRLLREQVLGPERFDYAFRTYIRRWAFKSPQPADFFRSMEDAAGADLAWFWRGWFLETGTLDQAVGEVHPAKDGQSVRVRFLNLQSLVMPLVVKVAFSDQSERVLRLPVEIWAASNRWSIRIQTGGRRVAEILVDPERAFPDIDRKNNLWKAR